MIDDPNYDPNCYWSKPEYNHNHVFSTHDHHSSNTISRPHFDQGRYMHSSEICLCLMKLCLAKCLKICHIIGIFVLLNFFP